MTEMLGEMNAGLVPIGAVVPYFGRLENLNEKYWQLCDGSEIKFGPLKGTNTPSLADLFLRGTTDQRANGTTVGSDFHKHSAAGNLGGSFSGTGTGKTDRFTGERYGWGDDDCHPDNNGSNCYTMEWNVNVAVSGSIQTGSHDHPEGKHVPRHICVLFIIRIA